MPDVLMRETRILTLYVTKYATTRGIMKVLAETGRGDQRYAYWPPGNGIRNQVKIGSNAFETLIEARLDAGKKFVAKRRSLEKQLQELLGRAQAIDANDPEDRTGEE